MRRLGAEKISNIFVIENSFNDDFLVSSAIPPLKSEMEISTVLAIVKIRLPLPNKNASYLRHSFQCMR